MFYQLLHKLLSYHPTQKNDKEPSVEIKFKVIVVEFYDPTNSSNGKKLVSLLANRAEFETKYLLPDFDLSFLNMESRNLFDLIDHGQNILDKTEADVLIWGCRQNNHLRLNIQIPHQYENNELSFISFLDSIYLPVEFLAYEQNFPSLLLEILTGTIISAIAKKTKQELIYKKYLLKKIIYQISQADSAKAFDLNYMPYILNQLGLIYMTAMADKCCENDFKTINHLFMTALKYKNQILEQTQLGCIYLHLGQLNDYASVYVGKKSDFYFREAIRHYQQAQKFFGKYTYPYDYGHICYKLSGLYYNYWKRTDNLQALRDAIFELRECERVFTEAQFPKFWEHIQGNLGYLLQNLGRITQSVDICRLAVFAYRNQQKIISENKQSYFWAQIQEKIAEIYYLEGKISSNIEALEEALACYHDALYFFETDKHETAAVHVRAGISKTKQLIEKIKLQIK